jgi:glyoxylase-like metal-dependent hydrolase (beta-lactamase superfamily II)
MRSLELLLARDDQVHYPTHGPAITEPREHVQALIRHRRMREAQVLGQLEAGQGSITEMVRVLYTETDPALHPAAERSVLAHLLDLQERALVASDGDKWKLAA